MATAQFIQQLTKVKEQINYYKYHNIGTG